MQRKTNESKYENKSNPSEFDFLNLTQENKRIFAQNMIEEANREEDVVLYFHLNPHLSRSFKWDIMRTFKKFKEFSSSLKSEKVNPFLEDLIKTQI